MERVKDAVVRLFRGDVSERTRRALRVAAVVLLILMLLILAVSRFRGTPLSGARDGWNNFFSSVGTGEGYPYKVNSSSVEKVDVLNGDIYILYKNRTVTLDGSAKEIRSFEHAYAKPAVYISPDRALVYDRGGHKYRVENRTELLHEGKTGEGEDIITACLGRKGNIALATLSGSATSRLTVWNSTYKDKQFVWNCADYTITSVALSENGRYVAVSVLGVKDGTTYSKIYVFDFEYSDPVSETEYPGTAILAVDFSENDTVVGVGDDKLVFLKNLKKNTEMSYGTSSLSAFTFSPNGHTYLVLAEYGSSNHQLLQGYSSSGRKSFEEPYDTYIKSVYASDTRVSVLTGEYADIYGLGGTRHRAREVGPAAIQAFTNGRTSFSYEMGVIQKTHRMKHQPKHPEKVKEKDKS
ncbi:MAG: hypothetical protein J6T14_05645 [Clostridia bacterium]|nr:hypothetical protein [Clostridia bacterium]